MSDGRDTRGSGTTPPAERTPPNFPLQQEVYQAPPQPAHPVGRARYGGVAPAFSGAGQPPRTADPYVQPPARDNPPPPVNNDGTDPFLDPGGNPAPGRGNPDTRNNPVAGRDLRPPDPGRFNPNIRQDWNTQQPGTGQFGNSNSGRALEQATNAKRDLFREARRLEVGSSVAQAGVAGISSALLREPITYGMTTLAGSLSRGEGGAARVARLYQAGFDPIAMHSTVVGRMTPEIQANMGALNTVADLDRRVLTHLNANTTVTAADEVAHLANMRRLFNTTDNAVLQAGLLERHNQVWGKGIAGMDASATGALHGTLVRTAENGGTAIMTAEELALLRTRTASLEVKQLEAALQADATRRAGFMTPGGFMRNLTTGFGNTLLTYGLIEADRGIKRYMYGDNFRSWETDGLLVPMAIGSQIPNMTRAESALAMSASAREASWLSRVGPRIGRTALFTGLALGAGHALDRWGPESPTWMPESMRRTTMFDAVPMGLAMTVPVRDWRYRLAAVGTAYVVGNILDSACSREAPGAVQDRSADLMRTDRTTRTNESFDNAVTSLRELGGRRFSLLEQSMSVATRNLGGTANMTPEQRYLTNREVGIVGRALGEYYLERGSRLNAGSTDTPEYVLRGQNIDLGGEGVTNLMASRNALAASRALVDGPLRGQSVEGRAVSPQESQDLQRQQDIVQGRINQIMGEHNIQECFQQLRQFHRYGTTADGATINKDLAWFKTYQEGMNTNLGRLFPRVMNNGRPDPARDPEATQLLAKALRDQCLARLAEVANLLETGRVTDIQGALDRVAGTAAGRNEILPGMRGPKRYDGIQDMLNMADFLIPGHPDVAQMRPIADRLENEARNRVNEQYDDPRRNPNSVDRTGRR